MNIRRDNRIIVGAERMNEYLDYLKKRRVAIFTNHTGCIGKYRLIDVLLRKGINIVKIFSPEHGFLGTFDDVVSVPNFCDNKTGIPILSLWKGKNDKENPENINCNHKEFV